MSLIDFFLERKKGKIVATMAMAIRTLLPMQLNLL
jgi:hypothetical protein